jgi:hypothetical protein
LVTAQRIWGEGPYGLGTATIVQAFYPNFGGFHFRVRNATLLTELRRLLLLERDITVGHKPFDMRFVVQASDEARVQALLGRPRIRELLQEQIEIDLVANPHYWSMGAFGPDASGMGHLRYRGRGEVSAKKLVGVFELFREILEALEQQGVAEGAEVEILISRLRARGGTIGWAPVVLWDGNQPRREAAAELGRLGDPRAVPALIAVLEGEEKDDELRGAVVEALGALGEPEAVGPLAALLGDRARAAGLPISEHAAQALRELGAGGLVDAFEGALGGDDTALRQQVGEHRVQVAEALLATMEGSDLSAAEGAARTLGRLGVREILPGLRRLQRSTGWDRIREAARQAIADLESMASLPRPAGPAVVDHDTLPRVADKPQRDVDTLPRSADPDEHRGDE